MLCWIILFAMITGNFGKYLGIPYLFLDPEYLNQVGFTSFFIMGIMTAGFSMAFHITCYISDGHRFSFVGALPRPFRKFVINNSIFPVAFLITYLYEVIGFSNQQRTYQRDGIGSKPGEFSHWLCVHDLPVLPLFQVHQQGYCQVQ